MADPDATQATSRPPGNPYARWLRTLPGPAAILVQAALLFTLTLVLFTLSDLAWPGRDRVDWRNNLVVSASLAIAIGLGELVAEARYGRDVLSPRRPMNWRAFGLFFAVVLIVMLGLGALADRLFG